MMKKFTLILIFLVIITGVKAYSQACYSPAIDNAVTLITSQTVSLLNRQLSGDTTAVIGGITDTIKSRHYQQPGNQKSAQFIYEKFQSYGLITSYWQFSSTGFNVIGKKIGAKYPNKKYIVSAHYDDMPTGVIAPGADDNASGTVGVLEVARLLASFTPDYTVICIAFDEEERGLYGSKAYADTAYRLGDSIMGVYNMDMIAWDGNLDNKLRILTNTNSSSFASINEIAAKMYVSTLLPVSVISTSSSSDHYYFWQRGYKATTAIEDDFNPYYHTVNDKFSNITVPYFTLCTKGSFAAFMTHALDYKIYYTHTPLTSTGETSPRTAVVIIRSDQKLALTGTNRPRLYYQVNGGNYNYVNPSYVNLDTFRFTIPGQSAGSVVNYYIAAQDSLSRFVGTLPTGGKGINPPGSIPPPTFYTYNIVTGISEAGQVNSFELHQNYPNPFNSETIIEWNLARQSDVRIVIYDLPGREIQTIIDNRFDNGAHRVLFDGSKLPTGTYFYAMYVNGERAFVRKLTLLK